MTDMIFSDEQSRLRALFSMAHIHSHSFNGYTYEDLARCTACQQDRAEWQPNKQEE